VAVLDGDDADNRLFHPKPGGWSAGLFLDPFIMEGTKMNNATDTAVCRSIIRGCVECVRLVLIGILLIAIAFAFGCSSEPGEIASVTFELNAEPAAPAPEPAEPVVVKSTSICEENVTMTLTTTTKQVEPAVERKYYVARLVKEKYSHGSSVAVRDDDGNYVMDDRNPILIVVKDGSVTMFQTSDLASTHWDNKVDGEVVELPENWETFSYWRNWDSGWAERICTSNYQPEGLVEDNINIYVVDYFLAK